MKKILFFFVLFFTVSTAFADVMPYYINSIRRAGVGLTLIKSPLVMRDKPSSEGKILETLNFDYKRNVSCLINKEKCPIDEVFSVYKEDKKIAFLSTIDSSEDWNLVCFNQSQYPICGWVEDKENKYYTWIEFFDTFGKKNGIYFFKDVQKQDKVLYSAPVKQTNTTGNIELPKFIAPWLVRGNWMLVKVTDFGGQMKTGWLNFRSNDGKLKVFVNF